MSSSLVKVSARHEDPLTGEFIIPGAGDFTSRMRWVAANRDASADEAYKVLGCSSLVMASHPFALFMLQKNWESPLEGMIDLVNYGGDCDTTAAMYGAVAGALHGMFVPDDWLGKMQSLELLLSVGEKIYNVGKTDFSGG